MSFLNPAAFGWLWLAAPVIGLYLLRLRHRQVEVPSLLFWRRMGNAHQTSTLWRKLRQLLSLLIHLLVLGGLVSALARPFSFGSSEKPRTVVLVLDTSASMLAGPDRVSRFELAREEARRRIRGLGVGDRAMLIAAGRKPEVVYPLTDDRAALLAALEQLRPHETAGDLSSAIRLASGVAAAHGNGHVVILSDGGGLEVRVETRDGKTHQGRLVRRDADGVTLRAPTGESTQLPARQVTQLRSASLQPLPDVRLTFFQAGVRQDNVAITRFRVRRLFASTEDYELLIMLVNLGSAPRKVTLSLYLDKRLVDSEEIALAPNEAKRLLRPMVLGQGRILQARLESGDRFASDDRAWCVLPRREAFRILHVHAGELANQFLLAALAQRPNTEVESVEIAGYQAAPHPGLVIFDRCTPTLPFDKLPPGSYLYIRPQGPHPPIPVIGKLPRPWVQDWNREHALLRFCRFEELHILAATEYELPRWMRSLMLDISKAPLIAYGQQQGRKLLLWAFDPLDSLLVVRPSFPNMVANLVDFFRHGGRQTTGVHLAYRTGETASLMPPTSVKQLTVESPDGTRTTHAVRQRPFVLRLRDVGLHQLRAEGFVQTLAANLESRSESDLTPVVGLGLDETHVSPGARQPAPSRELWPALLMFSLLLLLGEWFLYNKVLFF